MDDEERICGKCIYHRYDDGEWVCNNPDSECYGCYTEYRDSCNDFETRQSFQVQIIRHKKS